MSPAAMGKLRVTVQPSTLPRASRNCCGPSLCAITSLGNQAVDITAGMNRGGANSMGGGPYQPTNFSYGVTPAIRESIQSETGRHTRLPPQRGPPPPHRDHPL